MWPQVQINQLNQRQGFIEEIERTFLFIGRSDKDAQYKNDLITLNSQSDIDSELAHADANFRENIRAAQLNAGQNWQAYAILMPFESNFEEWCDAAIIVQDFFKLGVETIVFIRNIDDAVIGRDEIERCKTVRSDLIAKFGRWTSFIISIAGAEKLQKTWSEYTQFLADLQRGIDASSIMLVPSLYGNETGCLAGRLCDRSVTIADSPARVKTGSLIGLGLDTGIEPVDAEQQELTLAHLRSFHDLRYSVPMWYPDYDGMYWSDGRTLDVDGGDLNNIESVRVMDKIARRIRIRGIAKIADRSLNSTPSSIAAHKTYFAQTLREMSKSAQIKGIVFPGEIYPPTDEAIQIIWKSKEQVEVYATAQPYDCPKQITISIMLDKTLEA